MRTPAKGTLVAWQAYVRESTPWHRMPGRYLDDDKAHAFSAGLCEEAGEVAGETKRIAIYGQTFDADARVRIVEELGDALWYLTAVADLFGVSLGEVVAFNEAKGRRKFGPKGAP